MKYAQNISTFVILILLLLFNSTRVFADTYKATIIQDAPPENAEHFARLGDKILNYYEKLPDKTDQDRFLNAAKYFYYQSNKIDISNADALIGRARIALIQNDIRKAKNNLFIALNFNESNPKVLYYLGKTFFQDGDFDDAIKYYGDAYSNGYRLDYNTNLMLGICYEKMDDVKRAKYHYKNAIKIQPSETEAKMRLQGLDIINTNYTTTDVFTHPQEEEEEPLKDIELRSLPQN